MSRSSNATDAAFSRSIPKVSNCWPAKPIPTYRSTCARPIWSNSATFWRIRKLPTTINSWPTPCCSTRSVAAEGELPTCQDTGTAICIGHKGEDVYTGADDAEIYRPRRLRNLQGAQPALFAGGALHDDRGEEFGHEPARRRSISTATKATSTNSSSSPRAAAPPTRPSSTSRPRRC